MLLLALVFSPALLAARSEPGGEDPVFKHRDQLKDRLGLRTVFWVCSDKSKIRKIYCEDMGVHETEGPKAELTIDFIKNTDRHTYGLRHTIPASECRDLLRRIRERLKKNINFCIRGSLANIGGSGIGWVFHEFRADKVSVCENDDCVP